MIENERLSMIDTTFILSGALSLLNKMCTASRTLIESQPDRNDDIAVVD